MGEIIDGKAIANKLAEEITHEVLNLKLAQVVPKLAVILVGENPASKIYVRNKQKRAESVGIDFELVRMPESVTQAALNAEIKRLNEDPLVDGILVQLPLPEGIDEKEVVESISFEKDVDGFSPVNFGHLWQNNKTIIPSTAGGIMTLLSKSGVQIAGKNVVIINRSNIVGRPLAALMLEKDATVTIAHSKTRNLNRLTQTADILVTAVGRANFITGEMVKADAVVIDVGMNRDENNKLVGDVNFADVEPKVGKITPVPGGVGPMTIITLMQQVVNIAQKRKKR